jgi:hypothetical protein
MVGYLVNKIWRQRVFIIEVLKLPVSLFSARSPVNQTKSAIQLKTAVICFILFQPTQAFSVDVLNMPDKEFKGLSEEQLAKLPAIDVFTKALIKDSKKSAYQTAISEIRNALIFSIEESLYQLKYYVAIPHGEESPILTKAIIDFQKNIGATPTGVLSWNEFKTLGEKVNFIYPKEVRLPSSTIYVDEGSSYVHAEGTWVFENDSQADPIQTSNIFCSKGTMVCEETVAVVGEESRLLNLVTEKYQITKWTTDEIVAENDRPFCVSYTVTINLRKKEVHSFRRSKGKAEKHCTGLAERPQVLRLEDGFNVSQKYYADKENKAISAYNPEYSKYLKRFLNDKKK